jgi:acyl-CoA synthetase (NDP forming)
MSYDALKRARQLLQGTKPAAPATLQQQAAPAAPVARGVVRLAQSSALCYRTIWFEVAAASLCRSVATSSNSQSRNAVIFGNDRVALGQMIQ